MSRARVKGSYHIEVFCEACHYRRRGKFWKNLSVCKICRKCKDCGCSCRICVSCGQRHGRNAYCPCCHQCKTICNCRKRPGYLRGVVELKETFTRATTRLINPLQRPIAVEVELSQWGGIEAWMGEHFTYTRVHDGSVIPSGNEMVSSPLVGDRVVFGLAELGAALLRYKSQVNNTCGFHVHVDATDFSYEDIRRLLYIYSKVEKDIFKYLVTPDRESKHFCRPFTPKILKLIQELTTITNDKTKLKNGLYRLVFGQSPKDLLTNFAPQDSNRVLQELRGTKYGGREERDQRRVMRYSGLNIFSWFYRGTVEYRMKEGLLNPVEMLAWTLFCGWLTEVAYKSSDRILTTKISLMEILKNGVEGIKFPNYLYHWAVSKARQQEEPEE